MVHNPVGKRINKSVAIRQTEHENELKNANYCGAMGVRGDLNAFSPSFGLGKSWRYIWLIKLRFRVI